MFIFASYFIILTLQPSYTYIYIYEILGNPQHICLLAISIYILQNGDGFISAKELGVLMRAMGRNPTEDEIMQIMNEIDVDHNGNFTS